MISLPIELSERSSMVVSGAKKWGTWARPAEVQDTEAGSGEQEHLGRRQVWISIIHIHYVFIHIH